MNDYKTITKLFENDQDEIGFKLFKESNIIKLNNKNNNNYDNNQIEFNTQSLASKIINYSNNHYITFKIPIFLKDISDYFRKIDLIQFGEININVQLIDNIFVTSREGCIYDIKMLIYMLKKLN